MSEDAEIREAILRLTAERGPDKSICPSEAARALAGEARWQVLLPQVRRVAAALALEERIVITKKGKPVEPQNFKGVIRLKIAADGDA
jgi:hypothetical protein